KLGAPQWLNPESQVLAFTLAAFYNDEADLHVILNMSEDQLTMQLPIIEERHWHLAVDTALDSEHGIIKPENQKTVGKNNYFVQARSVVVFEGS
ncbi:MAG: glycogen debranching enzyme, partial [Gammaproteobacteria bacterium]|nr:glycogen debranching enzyme [Gammaproteobacteria bacterium]